MSKKKTERRKEENKLLGKIGIFDVNNWFWGVLMAFLVGFASGIAATHFLDMYDNYSNSREYQETKEILYGLARNQKWSELSG